MVLAACQTAPPDTAVPVPANYRAERGMAGEPLRRDWVRAFGSGELNGLVASAVAENLDVEAAIARIGEAEAQAVIARATLFPTLGATFDASRQGSSGTSGRTGFARTSTSVGLGLNAAYELDLFGKNRFAAQAAEDAARAAIFDRATISLATEAAVANAYFALLSSQDRLRIAQSNLATASRVLEAIRGRLNVGTGTALDVAQQESVIANQRARLPPLAQAVAQNRNVLAVLLGRTPESVRVRGGSLDALQPPRVRPGLPSELLLRRPDIASAEANLAAAEASIASARAAFFPTIQLTGSGGFQSAALATLLGGNSLVYSLASGITQPILDGWRLKGQLDFDRERARELAALYRKAIIQSLADVENALIAVRQSAELESRQRDAVAASQRALDITETRLREGTIDVVTLFTVQTTLFQAQDALALARLQRFQAYASLFQALGGGFTQDRAQALVPNRDTQVLEAAAP